MGKVRLISVLLTGEMAGRVTEKQFSGFKSKKKVLVLYLVQTDDTVGLKQ